MNSTISQFTRANQVRNPFIVPFACSCQCSGSGICNCTCRAVTCTGRYCERIGATPTNPMAIRNFNQTNTDTI